MDLRPLPQKRLKHKPELLPQKATGHVVCLILTLDVLNVQSKFETNLSLTKPEMKWFTTRLEPRLLVFQALSKGNLK